MDLSELAAKLEQGGIFRITPEEEALRNKCVRFAADMERLTKVSTVRFMVSRTVEQKI